MVDTTGALLVWEPRRVLPSYAVPVADLSGELVPANGAAADIDSLGFRLPDGERVLDPTVPFAVHTVAGESLTVRAGGHVRHDAAFRAADPDLADHVLLDFDGFDAWYEEDERVLAHPRDPFHRIDVLPSSRDVRIELDGTVLAHSTRPHLLFDGTVLPVRYYLPREDVRVPLRASATRTFCPYKGDARLLDARAARGPGRGPRVELPGPAARGRAGGGPDRVLQRARRRDPRRRAPAAADHALVLTRTAGVDNARPHPSR